MYNEFITKTFEEIMKFLIILLVLLSCNALATQSVKSYGKVSYNYIIDQPNIQKVYEFTNSSYSFEYGLDIDPEGVESYRLGFHWFSHLNEKGEIRQNYDPKYFEIFADKSYDVGNYYLRIGAGYKFKQSDYIHYADRQSYKITKNPLDKVSARFALGKKVGEFELGVIHYSNWFLGQPFSDKWEYHQTSVSIGYVF